MNVTPRKRGRGRPSKLTPETQEKILSALEKGNYRSVAARAGGVQIATLTEWLRRGEHARSGIYRDFYKAVERVEVDAEVEVVGDLKQKALKDPKLAKWWLAHRHSKRWGDNRATRVELTGKDGGPIKIEDARARLLQRLESLAKKREPPKSE